MAKLSIQQTAQYGRNAGFSGDNLVIIVAIAMAESSLDTHAINHANANGTSDYGILQINSVHFGTRFTARDGQSYTVSETAAFDPQIAFYYGYALSGGTNFKPWSTYKNGAYLKYIDQVRQALNSPPTSGDHPITAQFPPYSGTPWYNFSIEAGSHTDMRVPMDTPITAPLAGTITDLGYFDWGGQVTWKVDAPNALSGYKYLYVIHLDAINPNLRVGQHIGVGTFLGYSGGENSLNDARLKPLPAGLTHHLNTPAHSTGPHLDIGVTSSPTGSLDASKAASDLLVSMAAMGHIPFGTGIGPGPSDGGPGPQDNGTLPPVGSITGFEPLGMKIHNTLVQYPGFFGIAAAIDEAETFPGFINEVPQITGPADWADIGAIPGGVLQSITDTLVNNTIPIIVRGVMIALGVFLLLALLWQMAKPNLDALPELLKLGVLAA